MLSASVMFSCASLNTVVGATVLLLLANWEIVKGTFGVTSVNTGVVVVVTGVVEDGIDEGVVIVVMDFLSRIELFKLVHM